MSKSKSKYSRTFTPPTPESRAIIEKWVEMLRGGKFPQAKGMLRNDGGYCCLGVACKAAGARFTKIGDRSYSCNGRIYDLPEKVRDRIGLLDEEEGMTHASVRVGRDVLFLTALNDHQHLTFRQIAYLVEQDWLNGTPVKEDIEDFKHRWDQGKYKKKLPK